LITQSEPNCGEPFVGVSLHPNLCIVDRTD
jgi:hypothetical protein